MIVAMDLIGLLANVPGIENTLAAIARDPRTRKLTRLKAAEFLLAGVERGAFKIPAHLKGEKQ